MRTLPRLCLLLAALLAAWAEAPARAAEPAPVEPSATTTAATAAAAPTPDPTPGAPTTARTGAAGSPAEYRVGPGDTLQITVYGEPSLSGTFPVSDAGTLDFPLLGSVPVRGRSAAEITTLLHDRLTPGYLVNPNVTVWLASYRSQPVQVMGAVAHPGVYFLRGPTTVTDVLSEAGGVNRAGGGEVRLTRGGEGGSVTVLPYDDLLAHRVDDPRVEPGDVVSVPAGGISVIGQVAHPGEVAFRDGLTVSQCIAAVGGALPAADLGHVDILRGDERIRVNLRKVLKGEDKDVDVKADDRIYVRESLF